MQMADAAEKRGPAEQSTCGTHWRPEHLATVRQFATSMYTSSDLVCVILYRATQPEIGIEYPVELVLMTVDTAPLYYETDIHEV